MSKKSRKFQPKPDPVLLKLQPDLHQLSSEEQLFFIRITENIYGYNEQLRLKTLNLLSRDCNIKPLLPYLSQFIHDTIQLNIAFPDLSILIYTVRMVESLISNKYIQLKVELHKILPSVLSCVLSKKICRNPHDNHWILRDYSAKITAVLCRNFNNPTNNIKRRIIKLYVECIGDCTRPLSTLYGCLRGLICFGEETIKIYLLPRLKLIGLRLYEIVVHNNFNINLEIQQILNVIVNNVSPILLKLYGRVDENFYTLNFNYLGYFISNHIKKLI